MSRFYSLLMNQGAVIGKGLCLFVLISYPVKNQADALQPLTEGEMQAVNGGDAIQLTLRLRNNVDTDNNALGCNATPSPCRLGLEFSDRDGIWLVLKDFHGTLNIEDVQLQGTLLSQTDSSYRDLDRFQGPEGCLLSPCDPNGLPAIQLHYPSAKGAGDYQDVRTFLNIGRMAVEFDDGSTPGYLLDNNPGSALAFRASDSQSQNGAMQMRFDGRAYLYGF